MDSQGVDTIGHELSKLMKFGGTLPGVLQGNAPNMQNFTLNTAVATALMAASQTGTASGAKGLLKYLPLEDTATSKEHPSKDGHNHVNHLETQSIGTYANISNQQKQNLRQLQQLMQNSGSSCRGYGSTKDYQCSVQTVNSNDNTQGRLSAVSDSAKKGLHQSQVPMNQQMLAASEALIEILNGKSQSS